MLFDKSYMKQEIYLDLHVKSLTLQNAVNDILYEISNILDKNEFLLVYIRLFSSDIYNIHKLFLKNCATESIIKKCLFIGQSPLDSSHVSAQIYLLPNAYAISHNSDLTTIYRTQSNNLEHIWSCFIPEASSNSYSQSLACIQSLSSNLALHKCTLNRDVVRTWYYVRDIDNNYAGMIKARTELYEASGLTPYTHFIASTGIEGSAPDPHALVWLHSHAISGLKPEQVTYLKALDHMSPTHSYGVNFERATKITYGDREHCHISGTASIDKYGNVLHIGDVAAQFERAVENIEALLDEGKMSLNDLRSAIVYLRDPHDYKQISALVKKRLPEYCAININHAPVCRPDWLVEIEGEAIAYKKDPRFADFI